MQEQMISYTKRSGNETATLSPQLADYSAQLEYDHRGNATVTIKDKETGSIILDVSLDTGEIYEIDERFFKD